MSKYFLIAFFFFGCNLLFSQTPNLFLRDDLVISGFKKEQVSNSGIKNKIVTINFDFVTQEALIIPLFEDLIYARFKSRYTSPTGAITWTGDLEGQKNGLVILTKNNTTFFGKIVTDSGATYIIKPIVDTSYYSVSELIQNSSNDECQFGLPEIANRDLNNDPFEVSNVCDTDETCSPTNIDLIVFYTAEAMEDLGGKEATELAIAGATAEINVINANSNVNHTVTLVHTALTDLTETPNQNLSDIMSAMKNPNDGIMDEIPVLRDRYYADLVALITFNGSSAGTANTNNNPLKFNPQSAYSITKSSSMLSQYTLAHEIGHNLGLRHDRYAYGDNGLPNSACDYGWGWVNANANANFPNSRWRTIMAYNNQCRDNGLNCIRIPYFSNPDLTYNGDRMGADIGTPNAANNASLLSRAYCKVAAFRTPLCSDCEIVYNAGCVDYNPNTPNGPGNTTRIEFTQAMNTVQAGATVVLYVTYSGNSQNSMEKFNIRDENNAIIGETVPLNKDCGSNTIAIDIPVSVFNNWIADGKVTITLDPQITGINSTPCSSKNTVCAEFGIFTESLNIDDFEFIDSVTLYPNPTHNSFRLKSNSDIQKIHVYNNLGQFLFTTSENTISLENYPVGLYYIKAVSSTHKIYMNKIIKK